MKKISLLIFVSFSTLVSLFLISLTIYLNRYFGEVSLTQIIFHLNFANNLIVDSDEYIIKKFIEICLYLPAIIYIILCAVIYLLNKFLYKDNLNSLISNKLKLFSSSIFLLSSILYFLLNINIGNIKLNKLDVISNYYIDPKDLEYNFKESKNLVLIYVESYENIFSDKSIFGEDLLQMFNTDPFKKKGFKELNQTILTNWTIAAIVASQCGLPLKNVGIFSFGKNKGKHQRQVFGMKQFLPGAMCLSEILKKGNYKNIFVSSPNLSFSGTGNFFKTHGYDELYGKKEFDNLGLKYEGKSWGNGPNDSFLFNFSKNKIDNLISSSKFNLTILTTDTHEPNGYLDPNCKLKENNIKSVVKCSTEELYNFIYYLTDKYGDKINIVVVGDHQFRFKNNSQYDGKDRTIFNRFISDNEKIFYRNKLNFYDLFPSIVDFINIKYVDNKLGIGVSGFKKIDIREYNKRYNLLEENILNRSKFYENFWKN